MSARNTKNPNSCAPAKRKITRRDVLAAASTAAAFTIVPAHVLGGPRHQPPSEKLNIAGIGVGGMGGVNLANMDSQNIVAICDVDPGYAEKTIAKHPNARVWTDFREMLEKQKDIDAVLIATPDHSHAVIALAALQAGKHVYCQKPLTHDIFEARTLAKASSSFPKLTTQMGIQGHSGDGTKLIREWIESGALGEVREVDAWCVDSYYPWGHAGWSPKSPERPTETPPLPGKLNWDLWVGPAPMRPYHPSYHPVCWRAWWDFGSSWMADRGAHTFDPIVWALDLGAPTAVEATTLGQTSEAHCIAGVVTFYFAARGALPPVKLTWYEGMRAPRPPELEAGRKQGDDEGGALFRGTKGTLMCGTYGNSPRLIPEARMQEFKRPAPTLERVPDSHELDWVRACKAGKPAGAPFAYGALVTEICHLGNIAKRVDGRIDWDAEKGEITNRPDANRYVRREYREGWRLG